MVNFIASISVPVIRSAPDIFLYSPCGRGGGGGGMMYVPGMLEHRSVPLILDLRGTSYYLRQRYSESSLHPSPRGIDNHPSYGQPAKVLPPEQTHLFVKLTRNYGG